LKPPSSIVHPGAGPVIRPKGIDLHYEVELALIMGKQVRDLRAEDELGALDAVESRIFAKDASE
jgi:acylpyruvate hydrolase